MLCGPTIRASAARTEKNAECRSIAPSDHPARPLTKRLLLPRAAGVWVLRYSAVPAFAALVRDGYDGYLWRIAEEAAARVETPTSDAVLHTNRAGEAIPRQEVRVIHLVAAGAQH